MLVPEALHPLDRYIAPLMRVRRRIHLGGTSTILATEGTRVEANDVVAEVEEPGTLHVIEAARLLGVSPQRVAHLLTLEVGEVVEEGAPLATIGRLRRRTVNAPVGGVVQSVSEDGSILLRAHPDRQPIAAGLGGIVTEVTLGESLVIEGQGALLEGVWGSGPLNRGLLRLMVNSPDGVLPPAMLNAGLRGTTLIAGHVGSESVLRELAQVGINGLVVGSLAPTLYEPARQAPYPILLLEGWGNHPICPPIWSLLRQVEGRNGVIRPHPQRRDEQRRPELFVSHGAVPMDLPPPGPLAEGDRVRLLSAPYFGRVGTVRRVTTRHERLPSGLLIPICTVELEGGERVPIPYVNLERLLG